MKILFVSDWRGTNYAVNETDVDALIVLGDMDPEQIKTLDAQFTCPKLGLLGEHDSLHLYQGTNFIEMHKNKIDIQGITFAGFDGCPRYNTEPTPQYEEEDITPFCENLEGVNIFISHANPMLVGNFDEEDPTRGFLNLTEYIVTKQPSLFVHGHLKEMQQNKMDDTTILGVYPFLLVTI